MSDFIVLGLIPGTHLQITFIFWVVVVSLGGAGSLAWIAHRLHIFRNALITITLLALTKRQMRA